MEVIVRASAAGVFVYLDLLLYLFFYLHHDSCVAPLGVLQIFLLLGDCPTFKQTDS